MLSLVSPGKITPGKLASGFKRRAKKALSGALSGPGVPASAKGIVGRGRKKRSKKRKAPTPDEVPEFLEAFGFAAEDSQTWLDIPLDEVPEGLERSGSWLALGISEHEEVGGHTLYQIEVSLKAEGRRTVQWQVGRRLRHLRDLWHNPIKTDCGESYKQLFGSTPFAHTGGRRGTTARLDAWCARVAATINAGQVSPAVVALTLHFVEARTACSQTDGVPCQMMPSDGSSGTPQQCDESGTPCADSRWCSADSCLSTACSSDREQRDVEEESEEDYESDFESESESDSESCSEVDE